MSAVDGKHPFAVVVQLRRDLADSETGFSSIGDMAIAFERHAQLVKLGLTHLCGPPQPWIIEIQLLNVCRIKANILRLIRPELHFLRELCLFDASLQNALD